MNETDRRRDGLAFVSITPGVQSGQPCINGTRLTVSALTAFVARGFAMDVIEQAYPGTTLAAVQVACWYAAKHERKYRAWKPWALHYSPHSTVGLPGAIR